MNNEKIHRLVDEILADNNSQKEKLKAICSILKQEVYHYDWVGFYILDKSQNILVLGPYVGKPTDHTKIPVGKGVCGQVAQNCSTMVVQDVSNIDNYIACSIDVQSEIVVPIMKDNNFIAEIDIDSHAFAPFTNRDKELLETISAKIKELF